MLFMSASPSTAALIGSTTVLMALMAAYLLMRLIKPRPDLRELIMQPGMAGCLTALAATAIALGLALGGFTLMWFVPVAVLGVWIALAHHGRLRPEAGWIDRLGRLVAAGWCLMGLFLAWPLSQS